ncbi:MAG: HAD family hydrolase [Myxococcales bacterium]|nr:HAD family hydrolase [Myxococcales bacterium]
MSPRHVIWDWNGTLLDDAWLCVEVMNELLGQHALPPVDARRYEALFRFPVVDYYRELGFDFERTPFEAVGTAFINGYQARQHECRLQPHVHETFDALENRGVTMSVLSASQQSRLEAQARHHDVTERFVRLLGLDHHYADGKLELGRRWMSELNHAADEVLLIGDTDHDLHVAQALGIRCVLVPSGHQSRERLAQTGATLVDSLEQVAQLVD